MGLVQMGRSISKTAPSPCTSKTSSVPPKKTVIPSFIRVGEIRWDAVNFIYWVTNLLHPQKLTLLVFFSFRVRSSFQLLSFSSPWSFSVLHSFRGPFVPCGGGPSGLYHFFFKEWCLFSSYLYFCIALCYWRLYQWFFERSWLCVPG